MLRGSFTDVFQRYSKRGDSMRHEYFFRVSIWSNTNIATSLYAQARHLHLFQSLTLATNVLCSLKKSMRNFRTITCEFQTAEYLVFLKPYPVAGCVDYTASWNVWIFQHGVVFHAEPVRNVCVRSFRKFPENPTNRYLQPIYFSSQFQAIKIYCQFFNQYLYLTISYT